MGISFLQYTCVQPGSLTLPTFHVTQNKLLRLVTCSPWYSGYLCYGGYVEKRIHQVAEQFLAVTTRLAEKLVTIAQKKGATYKGG